MLGSAGWGEIGWAEVPGAIEIITPQDFQWTQGTVDLTRGSAIVAGVGTGFTNVSAGDLFLVSVGGDSEISVIYEIASVANDEQLTLVSPWQGPDLEGAPYLIHRRHGSLPRLSAEDQGLAPLMTYAFTRIDRALQADAGPPLGDWILVAGDWNDTGFWDDSATWQD